MKNSLFLVVFCVLLVSIGCKQKDDSPVEPSVIHDPIPSDIFPLTKGHQFEFGGYLTSASSETKINGTENLKATWTIIGDTSLTSIFGSSLVSHLSVNSALLVIDNLEVAGVITSRTTPVFIYRDKSNGDYYYLTNFGNLFRSYSIYAAGSSEKVRADSLRFIKLAPGTSSLNTPFTVFSETFQSYYFGPTPVALKLEIIGNYEQKTNLSLTVNGKDTTITSYYLTITNNATMGSLSPQKSINAKFWLASGIGPVQFFLAGDSEGPGSFRKLIKKNF